MRRFSRQILPILSSCTQPRPTSYVNLLASCYEHSGNVQQTVGMYHWDLLVPVAYKHSRPAKHERVKKGGAKGVTNDIEDEGEEDEDEEEEVAKPKEKKAHAAAPTSQLKFDVPTFSKQMDAVTHSFLEELAKIRTGRASPGILEQIIVPFSQHDKRPLKAVGTITVRDSTTLVVTVYDPLQVGAVMKAIEASPLKLQSVSEGERDVIVPLPRMTGDTIERYIKLVHQETEKAKIGIRAVRHKAIEAAKKAFPGTDDLRRAEKEVQAITDKSVASLEKLKAAKEKELKDHKS